MATDPNIQTVLRYFAACTSGDLDALKSSFVPDVVHYFLHPANTPIRGAEHLARYWRKYAQVYRPVWRIDHAIAQGDEVVSEWSCAYTPRGGQHRMMFRGTEWYLFKSSLIAEVRAYYQYDERRDCELPGFPYAERGYLIKESS